jgi:hypothetical protein
MCRALADHALEPQWIRNYVTYCGSSCGSSCGRNCCSSCGISNRFAQNGTKETKKAFVVPATWYLQIRQAAQEQVARQMGDQSGLMEAQSGPMGAQSGRNQTKRLCMVPATCYLEIRQVAEEQVARQMDGKSGPMEARSGSMALDNCSQIHSM